MSIEQGFMLFIFSNISAGAGKVFEVTTVPRTFLSGLRLILSTISSSLGSAV